MERLSPPQIRNIVKVDLHRHLDCSVRWSTFLELSRNSTQQEQKMLHELRSEFLIIEPMKDLGSVLRKFTHIQKIFRSEDILERIAFEVCEDAFNDGVRVLELRYAPTFIQEGNPTLSFESIHNAFVKGVKAAEQMYPINIGLICILQRTKSLALAEEVTDFVISNKDTFIGLDLADDETKAEPKIFSPLFHRAKSAGLGITIHSGETPDNLSPNWVKDSIEILGADRIGHGVQIIRNAEVMKYVANKKIPLEVCPISNYLTQAFSSYADHPIRELKNNGVLITINSDDPGIFASTLSDEYKVLQAYHGFTLNEFKDSNLLSLERSFLNSDLKQSLKKEFI